MKIRKRMTISLGIPTLLLRGSEMEQNVWKNCSSCKKPINFSATYYVCSVSTCNGLRTGYVFCSVPCFERHLPIARHKDAGAIEKKAPSAGTVSAPPPPQATQSSSSNRVYATASTKTQTSTTNNTLSREVLVIASRLKEYIFARSEYNTSGAVMDVLSDHLRIVCDRAIDNARAEGRKTVMDRDFDFLKKM